VKKFGMKFVWYNATGGLREVKKLRSVFLALTLMLIASLTSAGDVVYTMWEDDGGELWVTIQNDTDRTIRVDSILIVFYNAKGKPVENRNVACKGDCRLSSRDKRDFGPYQPPANSESSRVRNVRFTVE
jgi:hypothetical protein